MYGYSSEKKVNLLVWERTNWRRGYEQTGEKVEERKEEAARLITAPSKYPLQPSITCST